MENCKPITECLACGNHELVLTLDLNDQPLANNFRAETSIDNEPWYPLAVNRCTHCDHLQLTHAVDPSVIYTHYLYVSGTSQTGRDYMEWFAKFAREQFAYWPTTVLDIGCNDGTQLDYFKKIGFKTFGVDPAENLHPLSSANHNVTCGFWDEATANSFGEQRFDAVVVQNAFAHNPNPLKFLELVKDKLSKGGLMFIQTSQADMVLNGEFDTIYHEHISFYNAESMRRLAERTGLHLVDVVKTPIHGTSYIFVLSKEPANQHRIENILATEAKLHAESTYTKWTSDVKRLLVDLNAQIDEYRNLGYTIVGYGAAAKGMTLLNASDIHLDCVIDDNPLKQGLYCPGTTIPVVGIKWLDTVTDANEKIVFIPLAWNFYKEIKRKIQTARSNPADLFITYFPKINIES